MSLVSVVIPTIRRPLLVKRAIASVQAQTYRNFEIVVVIDGPDAATAQALAAIDEPRLRILQNPVSLCAGGARNVGARAASGEWIAFLDDDDEWLPTKLERQLAGRDSREAVLVSCRCFVENAMGTHLWPHRLYDPTESVDDYLFVPRAPGRGDTYLATPTFLLPSWLFARTGFGETRQNEDTTLLLRVTKQCGGRIDMLPDPLVIVHENPGESLGFNFPWRDHLAWIDGVRDMVTPRAYAGFCLLMLGTRAGEQRDLRAIPILLGRAFRRGAPTPLQLFVFASFWVLPGLKERLRRFVHRRRSVPAPVTVTEGSDRRC